MYLKADTTIDGLTITHGTNSRSDLGGGIYADGCSVIIRDSIITSNDAAGIYLSRSENSRLVYCEVSYNSDDGLKSNSSYLCNVIESKFIGNGGRGIFEGGGPFTITDSLFEGNLQGGLDVNNRSSTITNCIFRNNTNTQGAGGGASSGNAYTKFINCRFENNSTDRGGGFDGFGTLENCIFTGNRAKQGGGLHVGSNSTIKNCTLTENSATQDGGAIFSFGDNIQITNCNITKNTAQNGGGIYTDPLYYYSTGTIITACTVQNNSAEVYGGGVCVVSSTELINSTLTGNSASTGGGVYTGSKLTVKNCTLVNNGSSEFYSAYYRPVSLINTVLYNSTTPYIYNENPETDAMKLMNCAYSERSIYGSGNTENSNTVNISNWSASHPSEVVSVDNVAQTVFKLKASDTDLIHGGTNNYLSYYDNHTEMTPDIDQLGNSRDVNNPSIGAVEYSSGSSNNNPEEPSNGNTPPENPDNGGTTPENPDGGNSTDNPNEGTLSTGSSGGGGCNSFNFIYGLLVIAITLRRK